MQEQLTKNTKEVQKNSSQNYIKIFQIIISIFYLVGLIGMSIPSLRPYFQMLTPFHLLLNFGILLYFHKDWNYSFLIFIAVGFSLGYGSEVMGVHTGFPFGDYWYGDVLGWQLFEVPLMIGINWLILVYCTGNLFHEKISNDWLAAGLASLMMMLIDVIIEPVAVTLDFWKWESDIIPLSNFLGWLAVAFIIQLFYRKLNFNKKNAISWYLLFNLITFFAVLNFIL
ncbi:MAG: carotenoid biosynthesis protein [Mongoliibacter sp.]|uniref:carotenoid biosynthesis protein n=1 Tax=Mongoliibacter sp. TaxID=2022438 RepID=UPI0012EFE032|nr:carotenoid biosynthesis protein [Mongoliibacter sp.]TVP47498.1 MAG: carotenoid biosynthesis protein [Mongoliibacter sp.]